MYMGELYYAKLHIVRLFQEIYNSYPLVIEKNNLESTYVASLVQLGILQQRVKNLDRLKKQMHEIQSMFWLW